MSALEIDHTADFLKSFGQTLKQNDERCDKLEKEFQHFRKGPMMAYHEVERLWESYKDARQSIEARLTGVEKGSVRTALFLLSLHGIQCLVVLLLIQAVRAGLFGSPRRT